HVQQLCRTEPEQVEQIGVEADDAASNAGIELRIDARPAAEHAVDELAGPAAVAGVEPRGAAVERRIEELAAPEVGADLGRGGARVGHATALRGADRDASTRRPLLMIRAPHVLKIVVRLD